MNFKKIVPVFAAAITLSLTALAGTPETKSAAESKSTQEESYTYYVVSKSGNMYTLSLSPSAFCGLANVEPCEILTEVEHADLQISSSEINDPGQTTIVEKRAAF